MAAVEIGVPPSYAPENPKLKMDKKAKLHNVMMEVFCWDYITPLIWTPVIALFLV